MLLTFLISASLWTLYRHRDKKFMVDIVAKTGPRDIVQATANVSTACSIAVLFGLNPRPEIFLAFLGSIAAVNADTWATEIGTLSQSRPRLITTWHQTSPGTSGAVTPLGTLAGFAGSLMIAFLGMSFQWLDHSINQQILQNNIPRAIAIITASGFLGSLVDSLLGATIQVRYFCPICQKMTEQPLHRGVHPTQYSSGIRWLNNDWVNFVCSLSGALIAFLLAQI